MYVSTASRAGSPLLLSQLLGDFLASGVPARDPALSRKHQGRQDEPSRYDPSSQWLFCPKLPNAGTKEFNCHRGNSHHTQSNVA